MATTHQTVSSLCHGCRGRLQACQISFWRTFLCTIRCPTISGPVRHLDTPATMRDNELFDNQLTTFGVPVSDSQFQIIDRENKQRFLELIVRPRAHDVDSQQSGCRRKHRQFIWQARPNLLSTPLFNRIASPGGNAAAGGAAGGTGGGAGGTGGGIMLVVCRELVRCY